MIAAGIAIGIYSTIGMWYGVGKFSFLQADKLGHVGLLQAYLLAALVGIVLWMGSYQNNRKKWNRIGALLHLCILVVYAIHWNFLATMPDGEAIRNGGFAFHLAFLSLECWCGFFSK
jgi:hypothetical protein